jgi:hypothetical protein
MFAGGFAGGGSGPCRSQVVLQYRDTRTRVHTFGPRNQPGATSNSIEERAKRSPTRVSATAEMRREEWFCEKTAACRSGGIVRSDLVCCRSQLSNASLIVLRAALDQSQCYSYTAPLVFY